MAADQPERTTPGSAACPDCARCWGEFGADLMRLLVTADAAAKWLSRYHREGHDLEAVRAVI